MSSIDAAKLAKLQAQAASNRIGTSTLTFGGPDFLLTARSRGPRPGGKGTVRRKIVRKSKPANAQDDKKLQGALKKLNVQPIAGVEEVNMFREDGNVLHFSAPKGELALRSYGDALGKDWSDRSMIFFLLVCGVAN